jgi:hypothetical protein
MHSDDPSPITRALKTVETFSEKDVAVLPEKASRDLVSYLASVTGEDSDKIRRLYNLIIAMGRMDKYTEGLFTGDVGFAEEDEDAPTN